MFAKIHGFVNVIYYINSLRLSVTRQFCYNSILWQNRPLHFLWQNRPLYNFGAAGRGGGETHASRRSRLSVRLSLSYFKLPGGGGGGGAK
jgi:hypothetical protein